MREASAVPVTAAHPARVAAARRAGWPVWLAFALALAIAPLLFSSNLAISMLSQMGIAIIACLSYNILLGQGGMLSFGHAVYTGLGAYIAIHALNAVGAGRLPLPVSLVPLVGGVAGCAVATLLGYATTRRAGTTFAMITLGIGELVFAIALMFPGFFGGEAGISADRVAGPPVLGISFGPARQVYGLIAVYTFVCAGAMYAFTRTPLGRMLNAVRDNAQRAAYIGYDPRQVRYLGFIVAGFFAGIAGGLAALHYEIVSAEVVGLARSGGYLLFTVLGGTALFVGPIVGALLMVVALVLLSELTPAWLLYLGLVFMLMVMYLPGGIAGVVVANLRLAAYGRLGRLWRPYLRLGASLALLLAGGVALIEMTYRLQLGAASDLVLRVAGVPVDTRAPASWLAAGALLLAGLVSFPGARRRFEQAWGDVQAEIGRERRR